MNPRSRTSSGIKTPCIDGSISYSVTKFQRSSSPWFYSGFNFITQCSKIARLVPCPRERLKNLPGIEATVLQPVSEAVSGPFVPRVSESRPKLVGASTEEKASTRASRRPPARVRRSLETAENAPTPACVTSLAAAEHRGYPSRKGVSIPKFPSLFPMYIPLWIQK